MMYRVFTQLKHKFPGASHGNRCGHSRNFAALPALSLDGQKIGRPKFIAAAERNAHYFFSQHYKKIFYQAPHLRFAIRTQSGVMRSENREKLCLLVQALVRNLDLATMRLKQGRTLGEILRFMAHSLEAEKQGRRFSPERFFDGLNILRDAGFIHYRIPPAIKVTEEDKWQAQPAEIAITYRLWELLGFKRSQVLKIKNKHFDWQNKKIEQFKVQQEVLANKLKRLNSGAIKSTNKLAPKKKSAEPRSNEALLSKITTKLCLTKPIDEVRQIISSLKEKQANELEAYAKNIGL